MSSTFISCQLDEIKHMLSEKWKIILSELLSPLLRYDLDWKCVFLKISIVVSIVGVFLDQGELTVFTQNVWAANWLILIRNAVSTAEWGIPGQNEELSALAILALTPLRGQINIRLHFAQIRSAANESCSPSEKFAALLTFIVILCITLQWIPPHAHARILPAETEKSKTFCKHLCSPELRLLGESAMT